MSPNHLDSPAHQAALAARRGNPEGKHIREKPHPDEVNSEVDETAPDVGMLTLEVRALTDALSDLKIGANSPGGPAVALPNWIDLKLNLPILFTVLGVGVALLKQLDAIDARTASNTADIQDLKHGREVNLPTLQSEIRRGDTQDERLKGQAEALSRFGNQLNDIGRTLSDVVKTVAEVDKREAVMESRTPSGMRDR